MSLPPAPETTDALSGSPVPVVFIDVHTPSVERLPRVIGDDVGGGALAARHLLDLGHRSIAFIGDALADPFGFTSSRDRERGFREELARAGIGVPDHWIGHGAHGRYEARDLARRMLDGERRPTAIFTASDTQALGVIAAARELGLHVPDDLSVVGYDDIEAADYVGLTTVRQQLFESGRRGAEILLAEIDDRREGPVIAQLNPELVVRVTTAPPKEGRG
jgi:DNA-binding LacI/PurR family transcriptional regulator